MFTLIYLAKLLIIPIYLAVVIPLSRLFKRAGISPWLAFVPFINTYGLTLILRQPAYWNILWNGPFLVGLYDQFFGQTSLTATLWLVGFGVTVYGMILLARHYRQSIGFGLGLAFFPYIFFPILSHRVGSLRPHGSGPKKKGSGSHPVR
jgi:hypothetical protein